MPEYRFEGDTELGMALIAAVREVAAEQPDRKYEKIDVNRAHGEGSMHICVYVWQGEPSCLLGQGLWRCDLIDASFVDHAMNYESITHLFESNWWIEKGYAVLTAREMTWLREAQRAQDIGKTWSVAIVKADEWDRDRIDYS